MFLEHFAPKQKTLKIAYGSKNGSKPNPRKGQVCKKIRKTSQNTLF
jgi:hypothetical protein